MDDSKYESASYLECFEAAFEQPLAVIPFRRLCLRDEGRALNTLLEKLDEHYRKVSYPRAELSEVVPYVVEEYAHIAPSGFENPKIAYTPPVWHDEVRRTLLFAHAVVFEDPLSQILDVIAPNLNPQIEYIGDGGVLYPNYASDEQLELLRHTLINVQRLEPLIRAKIVIPHCMLTSRIPDYEYTDEFGPSFRDFTSLRNARDAAYVLGGLFASGLVDDFRFPPFMIRRAKRLANESEGWEDVDWWTEFFERIASEDKYYQRHPVYGWPDHLYRYSLHSRYVEKNELGYSLHFVHKHGYQLCAVLDAANLAVTKHDGKRLDRGYQKRMDSDSVYVQQMNSFLRPRLKVLKDVDLIAIRCDKENVFEEWRGMVRNALTVVRSGALHTGRVHEEFAVEELRDQYDQWRKSSVKDIKSKVVKDVTATGNSMGLSMVLSEALLHHATGGVSLALKGATRLLGTGQRAFEWREEHGLVERHFLSVI